MFQVMLNGIGPNPICNDSKDKEKAGLKLTVFFNLSCTLTNSVRLFTINGEKPVHQGFV